MKRKLNKKLMLFSSVVMAGLATSIIVASCKTDKPTPTTPEQPKHEQQSNIDNNQSKGSKEQPSNSVDSTTKNGSTISTTPTKTIGESNVDFVLGLPNNEPTISLDPGSDVGYFKINLTKLKSDYKLDDKVLILEIKDQSQKNKEAIFELKSWKENEPIIFQFVGIKEKDIFNLNNAYIVSKKDRAFGDTSKGKQISVNIPKEQRAKQIKVKVQSNKKELTEEDKKKTAVQFLLNESADKLELSVQPKQDATSNINDKYVRLRLFQFYNDEWTTNNKLDKQIHKIENNKIDLSKLDISEFKKNKNRIAIFVDGIYDKQSAIDSDLSKEYRFDYEDPNALFTKNGDLVLIKDFNSNNQ